MALRKIFCNSPDISDFTEADRMYVQLFCRNCTKNTVSGKIRGRIINNFFESFNNF